MDVYFSEQDRRLIENLSYDPNRQPSYDSIKDCLVWNDERPEGLTSDGYGKLCDLWIARSFIHRGLPFSAHELDPAYFEQVWSTARKQGFQWPGFMRLKLNDADRLYYEEMRKSSNEV